MVLKAIRAWIDTTLVRANDGVVSELRRMRADLERVKGMLHQLQLHEPGTTPSATSPPEPEEPYMPGEYDHEIEAMKAEARGRVLPNAKTFMGSALVDTERYEWAQE